MVPPCTRLPICLPSKSSLDILNRPAKFSMRVAPILLGPTQINVWVVLIPDSILSCNVCKLTIGMSSILEKRCTTFPLLIEISSASTSSIYWFMATIFDATTYLLRCATALSRAHLEGSIRMILLMSTCRPSFRR